MILDDCGLYTITISQSKTESNYTKQKWQRPYRACQYEPTMPDKKSPVQMGSTIDHGVLTILDRKSVV